MLKLGHILLFSIMNQSPHPRARVLAVDDMPEIRLLAEAVLGQAGYEVLQADGGERGLALAREAAPDLILLDVMMPGLDGYEVCRRLKQDEATRDIPVIFMSAQDDVRAQTQGFEEGAADYVTKPLSLPVLLARVRAHVSLHAQRRSLEGMFRDALEFAPDAIILADREERIVQVNAQALVMFGYGREELMGQPAEMLIPQRMRQNYLRHRTAFVVGEPGRPRMGIGVKCLRRDGSEFFGDISFSPLQTNRGRLLMAVVRDVTESRNIQKEITDSRQRLREMAAQGDAMREYERKSIAREVHDELGQVLTALRMDLTFTDLKFGGLNTELKDKMQEMRGLVDRSIQGVRNVASNLRPTALDMGLVPAIEWISSEFERNTGVACRVTIDPPGLEIEEHRAIGLFRIVQESLTNVTRYARASLVRVGLQEAGDGLVLQVHDDGQGFDASQATGRGKSFGLLGMQERALALGGKLEISSAPGHGTTITARVPLKQTTAWQEPA